MEKTGADLTRRRVENWLARLDESMHRADNSPGPVVEGILKRVVGMTMEATGCQAPVGGRCHVVAPDGNRFEAEVVGFAGEKLFLMPTGDMRGMVPNARIVPAQRVDQMHVGPDLLGRVVDGAGKPLDDLGPLSCDESIRLAGTTINPLARQPIREPLDVGIRAINSLLTVGRGQRIGLFAGSGVGKSRLLGMMTRFTDADVTVVGLIGERGREVKEFVEDVLGKEGMQKSVVVATPADHPPLMRMHGAWLATAIAEYFRDQGKKVLLLMDSLTRFAQAQREIALAVGEPPATKGYPPSVFAKLPQLVERAGNGEHPHGSITAFYTVLVEGDDQNDPIADSARAILDGHVVLSRQLAESGLYPAIDIEASISRAMTEITDPAHQALVRRFRQLYTTYRHNEDLISVGAYRKGSDPRVDEAIAFWPRIQEFLRQDLHEAVTWHDSRLRLEELVGQPIVETETTE
ncbi:MAG: flagellar protein export ATPase FliI [Gammaproteobacteria bacterium]|nr:flagellar protein export ATPase FliI [Gammaproteobacteria bacterium]